MKNSLYRKRFRREHAHLGKSLVRRHLRFWRKIIASRNRISNTCLT